MKILFLCKCSPFQVGGAEICSKEVARELSYLGHEVTVLCAKMEADEPAYQEWEGIQIHCKKVLPDFLLRRFKYPHFFPLALSNVSLMFYLPFFLRRQKFDLIREDISPFPPSGLLAFFRLGGAARSAVIHNLSGDWQGWRRYYGLFYGFFGYGMERILRKGWLAYDRILCPAKWFSEELRSHSGISDKVRYSPYGIKKHFFRSSGGKSHSESIQLFCVGRLVEAKGHSCLFQALSLLSGDIPSLRVKVLGEGPLKKELAALVAQLGLTRQVEFLPWASSEEMPKLYFESNFFILPSLFEGAPLTLLEAMASRVPVIAADIPGVREMVDEDSAVFFQKGNEQDLAKKIRWAIANSDQISAKVEFAFKVAGRNTWQQAALAEVSLLSSYLP